MTNEEYVYIRLRGDGKVIKTLPGNLELKISDDVIFECGDNQETARVISKEMAEEAGLEETVEKTTIIRKLTDKDKERLLEQAKEATGTIDGCREKINKHGLTMELVDADLSFDGKKLTFYFTSPGRVDFRSLVPDLASTFQKLIRLQQIGSRDKARYCGGVGRCGQQFCCKRSLKGDLESVTLDMAYEQNLGQMGSNRVTGACGKLMCCLKYELDYYKNTKKELPALGSKISTNEGDGIIKSQNILKKTVLVELQKDKKIMEVDC